MPRLIDADEAYKVLTDYYHQRTAIQHKALKEAFERVPTVDIDAITESHEKIGYDKGFRDGYAQATSEVRHGHWIAVDSDGEEYKCSECGDKEYYTCNYCPNCGAKMVEETDDGEVRVLRRGDS